MCYANFDSDICPKCCLNKFVKLIEVAQSSRVNNDKLIWIVVAWWFIVYRTLSQPIRPKTWIKALQQYHWNKSKGLFVCHNSRVHSPQSIWWHLWNREGKVSCNLSQFVQGGGDICQHSAFICNVHLSVVAALNSQHFFQISHTI